MVPIVALIFPVGQIEVRGLPQPRESQAAAARREFKATLRAAAEEAFRNLMADRDRLRALAQARVPPMWHRDP